MGSANESSTDLSLLKGLKVLGNNDAWTKFMAKYVPKIAGWCRALGVRDPEEVTAEVLLRIARSMNRFEYDPAQRFRSYLKTIAVNVLRDQFKKRAQKPGDWGAGGSTAQEVLQELPDRVEKGPWLPELQEELEPQRQLLEQAMMLAEEHFDAKTWEAFRLTTMEGQKGKEVAAKLGISVALVHKDKSRVVKWLRQTIDVLRLGSSPPK
jgi:RNA polymerase sigma factor (sigma-70 family)